MKPKVKKIVFGAETKNRILRLPVPLHDRLNVLVAQLKRDDPQWSGNKVCIEALRYYMSAVVWKKKENR